ncbi:TetR/AcrR family transcriptional regulator [Pseudonocardia sp. HH130630-07]|uniref:TetR/AcrR family transcriptional regulator n=1 Tax=Pseudonocardia sp. HH130630-07 TaxID=1690815 RepID=UPI0008152E30|nr:TetR family transcriptional regulator [Pseudonocardia sp. HH130630-07]ANY07755.1 TetR family transcriptional regulator [Pseudonocardia sp. HH130630-07]
MARTDARDRSTPDPSTDGRRARGERKRGEIIDACLRVVQRDGASGVTHRTVAREAGVPTSLTTYYFATLDELLVAALSAVAEAYAVTLRDIVDRAGDELGELAGLIAAAGTDAGRGRALAERELSTLASRRPALRPIAQHWRDEVARIGRLRTTDPVAVDALVAAADGLCAAILVSGQAPEVSHIRAVLARALGLDPDATPT